LVGESAGASEGVMSSSYCIHAVLQVSLIQGHTFHPQGYITRPYPLESMSTISQE
jgi:hypothetical protein